MSTPSPAPYVYSAFVTSVYDGDTLTANLDLGMSITRKCNCRLVGLDTPEIKSKMAAEKQAAEKARDRVRELVLEKWVTVQSIEKPGIWTNVQKETESGDIVDEPHVVNWF